MNRRSRILIDASLACIAASIMMAVVTSFAITRHQADSEPPIHSVPLTGTLLRSEGSALFALDTVAEGAGAPRIIRAGDHPNIDVARGCTITFVGWALDGGAANPASGLIAKVGKSLFVSASYGFVRPDVAAAFKNAGVIDSGYVICIPAEVLKPGTYELTFLVVLHGTLTFVPIDRGYTISVSRRRGILPSSNCS